jgi:hypothetical protein
VTFSQLVAVERDRVQDMVVVVQVELLLPIAQFHYL